MLVRLAAGITGTRTRAPRLGHGGTNEQGADFALAKQRAKRLDLIGDGNGRLTGVAR